MIIKKAGTFHGTSIYESATLGKGFNSAGLALPGIGIFVGLGTFSKQQDMYTVMHEYGHILQARQTGMIMFYLFIGVPSLISAWLNWHKKGHQNYWTEQWCNLLARDYFCDSVWPERRFPCKDIDGLRRYWLVR